MVSTVALSFQESGILGLKVSSLALSLFQVINGILDFSLYIMKNCIKLLDIRDSTLRKPPFPFLKQMANEFLNWARRPWDWPEATTVLQETGQQAF